MSGETQLLLWIAAIHLLGLVCVAALLVPALRDSSEDFPPGRDSDDGGGNDRRKPTPPTDVPRGGIPLPDAAPSRVRLREPGRLSERLPRRERRPVREPDRRPAVAPRGARSASGSRRRS